MTDLYIQITLALIGVLGLIFVIGFILKKKQLKPGIMNVVSYQSFGPKKAIVALTIGKEILLIGITPTDLKLLKTYHERDLESEPVRDLNDKLVRLKNIKETLYESK